MSQPTSESTYNPYAPSAPDQAAAPPAEAAVVPDALTDQIRALFERGKQGAGWFYWIAALSVVNTAMILGGSDTWFALGLGVTMITDSIAAQIFKQPDGHWAVLAVAAVFDVVVLSLLVLCGWLSRKRILPVFAIGMFLYLLDALLSLPFGFIGIAIHGFALFSMWSGFSAYRQLNALERQLASASYVPASPPAPVIEA